MYLIEGIPLTNIPRSEGLTFSYFHPTALKRGSVALAPIGRREVGLIVLSSEEVSPRKTELKKASFKLRPLKREISAGHVSEPMITFIEWMSRYYYASPGQFARLIIPSYLKDKSEAHLPLFKQFEGDGFSFSYSCSPLRFATYVKKIEEVQERGQQSLILFPEALHAELFFNRLPEAVKARALLWKRPRSEKKEYVLFKRMIDGDIKTIVGTRSSCLLPIPRLSLVVLEGEESDSHKSWDARPRYDARSVSFWRAKTYGIELIFGSDLPSLSVLSHQQPNDKPEISVSPDSARVHVVDMRLESASGNSGPLSEKLKKELYSLRRKQAILLVGRRGEYTAVICASCGKPAACEKCGSALITRAKIEGLYCRFCANQVPMPSDCSYCGGTSFKKLGAGAAKVAEEVSQLFPQLSVEIMDSDSVKTPKKFREIVEKFNGNKIDILVGTNMLVKPHILRPAHLTALIDQDYLFNLPEHDGAETALLEAYKMHMMARTTFIWQTHQPDNEVIYSFTEGSISQALENMQGRRKKYGWPPAVQLIQLTLNGARSSDGASKAEFLYQKLRRAQLGGISIYPPLPLHGTSGAWTSYRILLAFEKTIPISKRNEVLDYVPSNWDIDVDPVSTIN